MNKISHHLPGINVTFFTSEEKLRDEVDATIDALFGATFVYFENLKKNQTFNQITY